MIDGGLHRSRNSTTDVQVAEMHIVDLRIVYQSRFIEHGNLRAVELRPKNRKFVGTHIEIELVKPEERLITKARTTWVAIVGCIDFIDHRRFEWIVIRTDLDIEMRMLVFRVNGKNGAKPCLRRGIKIAARVAGELRWRLAEEAVHTDQPGSKRTIAVVKRENGIDFFQHIITVDTEALVRRFNSAAIHIEAVNAAQPIEILQQRMSIS